MAETEEIRPSVHDSLQQVTELLRKHRQNLLREYEPARPLAVEERERLRASRSYPEDPVGALMDFDIIAVRDDIPVEAGSRYLPRLDEMPDHTDQLFVVDREARLRGLPPANRLLVTDLDVPV